MGKRIPILLGIALMIVAVWMLLTPSKFVRSFIERLDNLGYDIQLRTHTLTEYLSPSTPIAIIDIDDKSLKAEGRWPWPRGKLAELTNELHKQGAAIIAYDMLFPEKEINIAEKLLLELKEKKLLNPTLSDILTKSIPLFDEDKIFAESLANVQAVLSIGFLPISETQNILPAPSLQLSPLENKQLDLPSAKGYISNTPILQAAAKNGGFINIFPDNDGIIRRAPLIMVYNNNIYPALFLQAVLLFLGNDIQLIAPRYHDIKQLEGVKFGNTVIPTDAQGQVLIPFIGKSYTFPSYSATDVLHQRLPRGAVYGKILFIGTSATGLGDLKATAIQNPFSGVEIQATLANGILQNSFSYIPEWTYGANLFLTVFFGLIAAFLFPYLGPRTLGIIIVFLPPLLLLINNWIWHTSGLILSLLMPVLLTLSIALLNIIYGYLFETRKRERLKEMFGQYVPEKHIDEMLRTTTNYGLHGEDREMSVLFADIRNFTTISEGMSASELVDMLNIFFTPMTEVIFKHRGTIDKYVGDLLMAFWGAPLKDKHHARHALESALEMQARLKILQTTLAERKWPAIKIGIGINSGTMSVGDMGSRFRRNYTVLGDEVNLASRIEGLTKFYGVDIIVTEHTHENQPKFIFQQLDRVRVKGKNTALAIYELICVKEECDIALEQELDLFHAALQHYFHRDWEEAFVLLTQLHENHPHKKLYTIYLERINEFKIHPPSADWDGVYGHHDK